MHSLSTERRWDSQVISISASWLLAAEVGDLDTPPEFCECLLLRLYLLGWKGLLVLLHDSASALAAVTAPTTPI